MISCRLAQRNSECRRDAMGQSGQVSVWVPIAVGMIGLIGVIVGQLINARREDRRWKRDQQREDVRWKRQREIELLRLTQESRAHWRDIRLQTYGKLLQIVNRIVQLSREAVYAPKTEVEAQAVFDEYNQKKDEFLSAALEAVIMTESSRLGSHIGEYMNHLGIFFPIVRMRKVLAEGKTFHFDDDERKRASDVHRRNLNYFLRLRDLIKEELGVVVKGAEISSEG